MEDFWRVFGGVWEFLKKKESLEVSSIVRG